MSDNESDSVESVVEEDINPKAHKRLVDGVSNLHTNQFIKKPTRNEPAIKRSEFHLVKPSTEDSETKRSAKVDVSDLVNVLDKTSKHLQLSKALAKTIDDRKVLPKRLETPTADKLQRAINYEKTKDKLTRWDAIVMKNRSADHLSFPLNQEVNEISFKDSYQIPSKFRIKSDMMLEMEEIEPEIFQIGKPDDDADQAKEDAEQQNLTRAEMIERSRELRQLRIKESQKSAKAHYQNKIKSKKYHRILKKEKMKQQIKEFEQLQKTDPEAALRKIEQLDRTRVEERANLRHRNTGTWAKNLQVRAKYDKDARKELADQIAISRSLTAKVVSDDSDDDANIDTDIKTNDYDIFNPWLKTDNTTDMNGGNDINSFVSGYKKYWEQRNQNEREHSKLAKNDDENDKVIECNSSHKSKINSFECENFTMDSVKTKKAGKKSKLNLGWIEEDVTETISYKKPSTKSTKKIKIVDNLDDLFDDAEDELKDKFDKKYKDIQAELAIDSELPLRNKKKTNKSNLDDNGIDLHFKKQIKRPKIDEELNNNDANGSDEQRSKIVRILQSNTSTQDNNMDDTENINPDNFSKVKHLRTALPNTIYTNEDDDFDEPEYHFDEAKKLTIAEAFEDDDIVADFKSEKLDEEKKNGPQEVDLSLPGWGSWTGAGIDPSKKKPKRRLILKFPAPEKRRNDNKGNLIIIENRDTKMQKHLVANLPFPFTNVADYEHSIRPPIGKDFIPATANRLLTKPAVVTKSGAIIEPMNENMLVKKRS